MNRKKIASEKFVELINIIEKLRSPGGCSWDIKQTSKSLIPYLLEETYEVIESIEDDNNDALKEELGDLMLHVLFQAQILNENKKYDILDSLNNICEKLVNRHPDVFNIKSIENDKTVNNWESLKQIEKNRSNLLDGVPESLPALNRAWRIQKKAASVGFDWEKIEDVREKLNEEINEFDSALLLKDKDELRDELGDILFSVVNLGRYLNINSEDALRKSIKKFERRFSNIETKLKEENKTLADVNLNEMDSLWKIVKKEENK